MVHPFYTKKQGKLRLWCEECQGWFTVEGEYDGRCPMCGGTPQSARCTRCGTIWHPRRPLGEAMPTVCSLCKSPYWNRERMVPEGKGTARRLYLAPVDDDDIGEVELPELDFGDDGI